MSEKHTGAPLPPGFYNMDCMKAMKGFPDKFFDLAIVDPPYGDGNLSGGGVHWNRFGTGSGLFSRYLSGTDSGSDSTATNRPQSNQPGGGNRTITFGATAITM